MTFVGSIPGVIVWLLLHRRHDRTAGDLGEVKAFLVVLFGPAQPGQR